MEQQSYVPNWGTQFDRYLIDAARRKFKTKIVMNQPVVGWTSGGNTISGVLGTIDANFIRVVSEEGNEVWLSRRAIVSIEVAKSS